MSPLKDPNDKKKQIQVGERTWKRFKMKAVINDVSMKDFMDILLDHWEATKGDKDNV